MRTADKWQDYELLDASSGERLERWGDIVLIRPDPQVIWKTPKGKIWKTADAKYERSNTGGGKWTVMKPIPDVWSVGYRELKFNIKTMGFKHTGLFPEQAVNWDLISELIRNANRPVKVLNMFAYTGGATVSALAAGSSVTHVDASKGMTAWAKENAVISGVADKSVRWLVDDCAKFAQREIRRGNKYDIIIMDPPSYGRGPGGEVWKLEDEIYPLVETCSKLLSDDAIAFLINSYTTGLSPAIMSYILGSVISKYRGGKTDSDEIGLKATESGLVLPCGASSFWFAN